jgi:hypothetical protein
MTYSDLAKDYLSHFYQHMMGVLEEQEGNGAGDEAGQGRSNGFDDGEHGGHAGGNDDGEGGSGGGSSRWADPRRWKSSWKKEEEKKRAVGDGRYLYLRMGLSFVWFASFAYRFQRNLAAGNDDDAIGKVI